MKQQNIDLECKNDFFFVYYLVIIYDIASMTNKMKEN